MEFETKQEISFATRMQKNLPQVEKICATLFQTFEKLLGEIGELEASKAVNHFGSKQLEHTDPIKTSQVHSICFQIQNLVENAISLRITQQVNFASEGQGESGFWKNYLNQLKQEGILPETITKRIQSSFIEVVYTKHPTEAKRWIILQLHRKLSSLIFQIAEEKPVQNEIEEVLELLWRTGELFASKPTVAQERRNLDYYFTEIFPIAREALEANFREAWDQVFPTMPTPCYPMLRLATWVGGDRDGHPLVTASITEETLVSLRTMAIEQLRASIKVIHSEVRFQNQNQPMPTILNDWLSKNGVAEPANDEWTAVFDTLDHKLANTLQLVHDENAYRSPSAFKDDIQLLESAFQDIRANRLIRRYLEPLNRQLDFYGFHTARVDIRQNSEAYRNALTEILIQANVPDAGNFPNWEETEKLEFIAGELANNRPFLLTDAHLTAPTREVLDTFKVIKKHIDHYGEGGIGNCIVSMTKQVSDLLTLFLFCKEVGLLSQWNGKKVCNIKIVPLFETMADLESSVEIMERFLSITIVRDTLEYLADRHNTNHSEHRVFPQTIMLGYSDSNKDCGIWASQWTVYNTQKRLINLSKKLNIPMRFFHGRGGTVGRGSGPMHRFIEALPQSGLEHGFRITEQGEIIGQKYNSSDHAVASFEQLVAGVSCARLLPTHDAIVEKNTDAMMLVRDASLAKYRSIIEAEGFLKFYRSATPIDVIERSNIGSRPSRRTGTATLEDLRAIPWVFSWNQSRFYLPGWFGIGTGLKELLQQDPASFDSLRNSWRGWPFLKYLLYNAESTVASCSIEIMKQYAELEEDPTIRETFLNTILEELTLAEKMLSEILTRSFSEGRPRLYFTIKARNKRLHTLHMQQIALLKTWRKDPTRGETHDPLLPQLLQSINAIASGLKTTG